MVSGIKLFSRVCHVVGAMAFLALQVNALLRTTPASESPSITINPLPALGLTSAITVNSIMATEIISTIVLISGFANAGFLRPRTAMINTPNKAKKWRGLVYGLKFALFFLATPLAKTVVKSSGLVAQAAPATAENTLEIERTAAVIRIAAIVGCSLVGAFARYYREEATAISNSIEAKKSSNSSDAIAKK